MQSLPQPGQRKRIAMLFGLNYKLNAQNQALHKLVAPPPVKPRRQGENRILPKGTEVVRPLLFF